MTIDRTITSIPFTVGNHSNGYWLVRDMQGGTSCSKCAFYGEDLECPAVYIENKHQEHEPEFEAERQCLLCTCFGDTTPVYFVEVTDDEIN
jgi:hypothetical protein